jgi:dTMP kinase
LVAFDELVKKIIKPNLLENKMVVVDRYIDSTFVYQGIEGGIKINVIQEIAQKTINLPFPDLTFVLDIEPQKAQERLRKRKEAETGEYNNWDNLKLDFHQRIRNNYLKLKKIFPERIYVIDANKSEKEVTEEV